MLPDLSLGDLSQPCQRRLHPWRESSPASGSAGRCPTFFRSGAADDQAFPRLGRFEHHVIPHPEFPLLAAADAVQKMIYSMPVDQHDHPRAAGAMPSRWAMPSTAVANASPMGRRPLRVPHIFIQSKAYSMRAPNGPARRHIRVPFTPDRLHSIPESGLNYSPDAVFACPAHTRPGPPVAAELDHESRPDRLQAEPGRRARRARRLRHPQVGVRPPTGRR